MLINKKLNSSGGSTKSFNNGWKRGCYSIQSSSGVADNPFAVVFRCDNILQFLAIFSFWHVGNS